MAGMYFVFEAVIFCDYGDNDRVYSLRHNDKKTVQKAIDQYILGQRPSPARLIIMQIGKKTKDIRNHVRIERHYIMSHAA